MNIFLKNVETAEEAVKFLREEGILTEEKINCNKIAEHYQEILDSEDLQNKLLDIKDIQEIKNIPAEKRQEKISEIASKGLIPWRQGLRYLPRWNILMKEFEQAVEQSA